MWTVTQLFFSLVSLTATLLHNVICTAFLDNHYDIKTKSAATDENSCKNKEEDSTDPKWSSSSSSRRPTLYPALTCCFMWRDSKPKKKITISKLFLVRDMLSSEIMHLKFSKGKWKAFDNTDPFMFSTCLLLCLFVCLVIKKRHSKVILVLGWLFTADIV